MKATCGISKVISIGMKQVTKNGRNLFRAKVFFKRVATEEEAQNVQIQDGQLLYVKETGNTYMDYGAERISTGGGSSKGSGIPIGTVIEWHSDTLPTDGTWLWTDHEYLKEDYPDLYSFCGDRFNKEDTPLNSFRTPNRAGLVAIGVGTYTDQNNKNVTVTLGNIIGEFEHTLTEDELAEHIHSLGWRNNNHFIKMTADSSDPNSYGFDFHDGTAGDVGADGYSNTVALPTGGNQPHNNVQPSVGVNYIIKAVKSTKLEVGEVVNSLAKSSTTNAPSVDAVNGAIKKHVISIDIAEDISFSATAGQDQKLLLDHQMYKCGSKLEFDSTNKRINIAGDVSSVMVSGCVTVPSDWPNGYFGMRVYKNGQLVPKMRVLAQKSYENGMSIVFPATPIEVSQGDYLEVFILSNETVTNKTFSNVAATFFTVEAIE